MQARAVKVISKEQARLYLLGQLKLKSNVYPSGGESVEEVLKDLRVIQVDSLDPMGYSHELVVMARVDGVHRGTMFRHLPDGSYFEHWAKERCVLPASAFPYYHNNEQKKNMNHWWYRKGREVQLVQLVESSDSEASGEDVAVSDKDERRLQRTMNKVLREVKDKGPQVHPALLTQIGSAKGRDWHGEEKSKSATSLALEVLWRDCRVVITRGKGRDSKVKLFSTPDAIFPPEVVAQLGPPLSEDAFARWAVLDRVEAAGLLPRSSGPHWSVLDKFRNAPIVDQLLEAGDIEEVQIEGSRTRYLAPKGWTERQFPDFDDRMRIIAPLDPLVWHRPLIQHVFGFEYVWEVYKKEALRTWGWYVCPLLYRGRFVGRIEGKVEGDALVIKNVWKEEAKRDSQKTKQKTKSNKRASGEADGDKEQEVVDVEFNEDAFRAMLKRHAEACGASSVVINGRTMAEDDDDDNVPLVFASLTTNKKKQKQKTNSSSSSTTQKSIKKKKKPATPTKRKRGKAKLEDDEEEEEPSFDDDEEEDEGEDEEVESTTKKLRPSARRRSARLSATKKRKADVDDDEGEEEDSEGDPSWSAAAGKRRSGSQ